MPVIANVGIVALAIICGLVIVIGIYYIRQERRRDDEEEHW